MTKDGKKSADKFSVAESQIMDISKHRCREGNVTRFPKEISFYFFFLVEVFQAYKDNQLTDTLLDFSVFLHLSLSVQCPAWDFQIIPMSVLLEVLLHKGYFHKKA